MSDPHLRSDGRRCESESSDGTDPRTAGSPSRRIARVGWRGVGGTEFPRRRVERGISGSTHHRDRHALGQSVLDWGGIVGTHHTNNFDQWHMTWTFRNLSGTVLAVLGPIDGPRMNTTSLQFGFNTSIPVNISFDNWAHIASVTWRGEC